MTQQDALDILKTGANVFLTGEPGSGKTHTLNQYIAWLREHAIEPSITASTGIAATHVGGQTIHAWSGIGILDHLSDEDLDRIVSKEHVAKRLQRAQVLIIDEVSMLSAETLSMVDRVMREVRRDERVFGGVQVIFCGDFFQLPPVTRGGRTSSFAFTSPSWRAATVLTCYLTEQFRQEDSEYLTLLQGIREGLFEQGDIELLRSRVTTEKIADDTPLLYTHNVDVDALNEKKLETLPSHAHTFSMDTDGTGALVDGLKRGCLSPEKLVLKKDAIVMCTKNNPVAGYVNGTLGKILGFSRGSGDPIIETKDGREITISKSDWIIEENGKIRARISQIPLRLAWAITVHKSQGLSLDSAAIDLSKTFEYGQGYVALSRVRSLEGLHILGWSAQACRLHPDVRYMDERFRDESLAAVEAFETLRSEGDLQVMQNNFVLSCGGTLTALGKGKKMKKTTYDETHELLLEGLPLGDIAKTRSLTVGTIADHAQKLVEGGRLDAAVLLSAIPAKLVASLPDIHAVFEKRGADKLAPVYHDLLGKYSYDDLKLARVLFEITEEETEVY